MSNVDLIKQAYDNLAIGHVEEVLSNFDPSIEWSECNGMPFVKGDGIYIGPEAVVTEVFMNLPVFFDGFNIEIKELIGAGDKVTMVGYYKRTNKATGNSFKANATHVWTIKDEKATHFFQAVDTAAILR